MTKINKIIKDDFNDFFEINLNGEWELFEIELDDIKNDLNQLSKAEIKSKKEILKEKIDGLIGN